MQGLGGVHNDRSDGSVNKMEWQMKLTPHPLSYWCNGLTRHHKPRMGAVTSQCTGQSYPSPSESQEGRWLLVCVWLFTSHARHGMTHVLQSCSCGQGQGYHDGDKMAGTCDGSSGIHILYSTPIRRKNLRRTARSSGIRSKCIISHK